MSDHSGTGPRDPAIDPSLWRGMTQSRLSRRQLLTSAGTGAGMLGLGAILSACGVKGTPSAGSSSPAAGGVGTAAWWAKQKSHKTVNFANWPYYIDVLKGKHLSLEHFTAQTGIAVTYTEPIGNNLPFYAKITTSLTAKQPTGYDIIVTPNVGVVYTRKDKKIAEHGRFSHDDTNVMLLVSNPRLPPEACGAVMEAAKWPKPPRCRG